MSSERGNALLCWGSHHSLILYCLSIIHCVDTKSVSDVDSTARPSRSSVLQICSELSRLFKRTGSRNPKLIGLDNSFMNESIPEATVSTPGPGAFHQLVGSTPKTGSDQSLSAFLSQTCCI